jgi:predicted ATPase
MADLLRRDETVLRRTNAWMKRFEIGYQLRLRALSGRNSDVFEFRLVDQTRRPKVNVSFSDVGFGISQLLPILVQSIATEDRVITIEQPELHVHPRLQAEIGDLLVDCVEQNGHQFLVETHSEHLILRLRRLVREGKIDAKHISVIYVGRGREGSTVQQIGLKPDGTFDQEWPGGFFPERLRELL